MAYRLPHAVVTRPQLEQLKRELEGLTAAQLTKPGRWSASLSQFIAMNRITTLTPVIQKKLISALDATLKTSPQISISLGDLPDAEQQTELVTWLRSRIHPQLLLHLNQDSDVMAGCIIRTDHEVYDMSLKSALFSNTAKLAEKLS